MMQKSTVLNYIGLHIMHKGLTMVSIQQKLVSVQSCGDKQTKFLCAVLGLLDFWGQKKTLK